MDELEQVANRAQAFERDQEKAADFSDAGGEQAATISAIDPMEAAANMAESLLKVAEAAVKLFGDSRIAFGGDEIGSGKESLAPVIDKYGLVTGGTGRLPFQEEIQAGFYVGGLWRRVWRSIKALREQDKAAIKAKEQAGQYGEERKHGAQEQARAVSGKVGVRQEPNAYQAGRDTEGGREGDSLGQQQGSSGT